MDYSLSNAKIIELFHIAFLDVLASRLDPARYILKGGTNLRYFFESLRYSEDMDLDMCGIEPWRLAERVDSVLGSSAMQAVLRIAGLEVAAVSNRKQTETTQRWRIALHAPGRSQPVRTKVEFSNRNGDPRYRLEPIPARIVEPYALRAPSVQHYVEDAPTEQKVKALAWRSETQARDAFDLELLLRRRPLAKGAMDPQVLSDAADRALEMPFAAFRDQVLPFLEPDVAGLYETEAAWEQIQTFVAERLEAAR
jgi:Nucleotidyl transferase AbiEii toxin, Type IV TA system